MTIRKLDARGQVVLRYPARLLEETPEAYVVEAEFTRGPMDVGGLRIGPGDRFVETFYRDRWYNVFAMYSADGRNFKGWYCNLARPAVRAGGEISSEDLALDLVVRPDRSWTILDGEEFEALGLSQPDYGRALAALEELKALAASGMPPFEARD